MKSVLTILITLFFITAASAGGEKYVKAMKKNLAEMDSANSVEQYINTANKFERIALAEKTEWLPYYYSAFLYTIASFSEPDNGKKDSYLDKADAFILNADSLSADNSEIYTLKGMIGQARMQIDPMNRWMKYGAEADKNLKKAVEIDSLNPRPLYLIGAGLFYTPEQFGGGKKAALPYLEKSLKNYDKFKPASDIHPKWGREIVENFLKEIEASK